MTNICPYMWITTLYSYLNIIVVYSESLLLQLQLKKPHRVEMLSAKAKLIQPAHV